MGGGRGGGGGGGGEIDIWGGSFINNHMPYKRFHLIARGTRKQLYFKEL